MIALLAAAAGIELATSKAQAAAADAMGASYPIRFDFGRIRPRPASEGSDSRQPVLRVSFHGGPVQTTTTPYLIWWLPSGAKLPANYQQVVRNYFADIGGSALYDVLTVYSGSNGSIQNRVTPGGEWTDGTAYPESIRGNDVSRSIARALAANPSWKPGLRSQFYVLTAQNAPVAASQFCAYHTYYAIKHSKIIYAYIPDPVAVDGCQTPFNVSPNNDLDVDSATTSINHEQAEMASDPLINAWYSDSKNTEINGSEIADLCIYDFGIPLKADGADLIFSNGDEFMAQELFDNSRGICAPTL